MTAKLGFKGHRATISTDRYINIRLDSIPNSMSLHFSGNVEISFRPKSMSNIVMPVLESDLEVLDEKGIKYTVLTDD